MTIVVATRYSDTAVDYCCCPQEEEKVARHKFKYGALRTKNTCKAASEIPITRTWVRRMHSFIHVSRHIIYTHEHEYTCIVHERINDTHIHSCTEWYASCRTSYTHTHIIHDHHTRPPRIHTKCQAYMKREISRYSHISHEWNMHEKCIQKIYTSIMPINKLFTYFLFLLLPKYIWFFRFFLDE